MTELVSLWVHEFIVDWKPIDTAPFDRDVELADYQRRRQTRSHISLPTYYRRLGERRNQETALLRLAHTLASLGRLAHELASSQKLRQLRDIRRDPRQPALISCTGRP